MVSNSCNRLLLRGLFSFFIFQFLGCGECVNDPLFFKRNYTWSNLSSNTKNLVNDDGFEFDPRWFPIAGATDVSVEIDIDAGEVKFHYLHVETSVTELWEITEHVRGEFPRDECFDE